jgi:hypothetical protein
MNPIERDDYTGTGEANWTSEPSASSWSTYTSNPDSPDYDTAQRFRYLLRVATPAAIEAAHFESFSRLTDWQRNAMRGVLASLDARVRADASDLARVATLVEQRMPGTLARLLGLTYLPGAAGVDGELRAAMLDGFVHSRSLDGILGPADSSSTNDL